MSRESDDDDRGPRRSPPPSPVLNVVIPLQFSGGFLQYAVRFFVLAVVATLVGFRRIARVSMKIVRVFVFIFLVLAAVSLVL